MTEYWESRFKNDGAMWKFEPADSAQIAMELFKSNGLSKILIPGVGYGRNAKLFYDHGFDITGIEISESAIKIAKSAGLDFPIYHGSVTSMPFDNKQYDGIFCYAMIHLLNRSERRNFLMSCYHQLKIGGTMIFVVSSKQMNHYGTGKYLSNDRYEISKGLKVYFYDNESIEREFMRFGLTRYNDIDEPVKFMAGQEPLKLKYIVCTKK